MRDLERAPASCRYMFRAKGAAFTGSLGQRAKDMWTSKAPALKARFTPSAEIEARFQRLLFPTIELLGRCPRLT